MAPDRIQVRGNKLELLQQLAAVLLSNRGWNHLKVRGWKFSDEFAPVEIAMDHGARAQLVRDMMIERDDVGDPARRSPWYLFRITQFGIEVLQGMGLVPPDVAVEFPCEPTAEDRDTIFMSMDAWRALEYLGTQSREGWETFSAIRTNAAAGFFPDDVEFLVKRQLIVVDRTQPGGHRYRATPLGRGARALDVTTIKARAQVLVPGIREQVQPPKLAPPRRRSPDALSGG